MPAAPRPTATPRPDPPGPGAPSTNVSADFDAQKKRNRILIGGAVALALIAAFFGARGLLKVGANTPKPALQVRGDGPAPALALPAQSKPVALTKEASRPVMPADVEAWLKHLEECERRKVEISGDQMAEAMVLMQKMQALGAGMGLMNPYDQSGDNDNDQDPGSYTKGKMMDFRPRWEALVAFFNSKTPPEECRPLAADFNRALSEVPGMMGDLGEILNSVSQDPSAALQQVQKFKGGSYADIDRYFARADVKLSDICTKYQRSKWFNIKADVQGGSPLAAFGNVGSTGGLGGSGLGAAGAGLGQ